MRNTRLESEAEKYYHEKDMNESEITLKEQTSYNQQIWMFTVKQLEVKRDNDPREFRKDYYEFWIRQRKKMIERGDVKE